MVTSHVTIVADSALFSMLLRWVWLGLGEVELGFEGNFGGNGAIFLYKRNNTSMNRNVR